MYSVVFILCVFCFQIFVTLSVECIDSFPPVHVPEEFGGTFLNPGTQVVVDGLAFQGPANITAVHLGGTCNPVSYPGTCYGVFQVWRPSGGRLYSLVYAYPLSVSVSDANYFSTSVPLVAPAMSVESGDILGFSAPNTDAQSHGMGIPTTSAAGSLGATLYEFQPGEVLYTRSEATLTTTNVLLVISPEVSCHSLLISTTVNEDVTPTIAIKNNNNNNPTAPDDSILSELPLIIGVVTAVVVVLLLIVLVVVAAVVMVLRGKRKKAPHSTADASAQPEKHSATDTLEPQYTALKVRIPDDTQLYTQLNTATKPEKTTHSTNDPLDAQYTSLKAPDVPQLYTQLNTATNPGEHTYSTSGDHIEEYHYVPMMDENRSNLNVATPGSRKAEGSYRVGEHQYASVQSTQTGADQPTVSVKNKHLDNKHNITIPSEVYEEVGIPYHDMEGTADSEYI